MKASIAAWARSAWPLWLTCAAYLALRALALLTRFEAVSLPNYELMGIGNFAKIASEGWSGVRVVTYFDNSGGQLLDAWLAVPLYWLFGDGYQPLKLVPVLLGLGSLILIWRILERAVSRRAAILGVLLFALTPPTLVKYSMLAKGNHFENLFFQLATLALFLRAHASGAKPRANFAWALAAGFAVFISLDCLFLVASLAVVHAVSRGWRASALDLRFVMPGLLVGLAPLAWVQWSNDFSLVSFLSTSFESHGTGLIERFPERLLQLWTDLLPRAGAFEDLGPLPAKLAETAYLAAFLVSWASLAVIVFRAAKRAVKDRRSGIATPGDRPWLLEAPLVMYLPMFSVGYAVTTIDFDVYAPPVEVATYRYLVPHFLFSTLIIAVASARWLAGTGMRRALGGALGGVALLSSLWTLPIVDWSFSAVGSGERYPGYDFNFYSNLVLKDVGWRPDRGPLAQVRERIAERIADFSPEARGRVWFGVGSLATQAALAQANGDSAAELAGVLRVIDIDRDHMVDLARGVGSALRRRAQRGSEDGNQVGRMLEKLDGSNDALVAYVVEGLCLPLGLRLENSSAPDLAFDRDLRAIVPASLAFALNRGEGMACGRLSRRAIPGDLRLVRKWIQELHAKDAADFWFGFGAALAESNVDGSVLLQQETQLTGELRDALLAGFGAELRLVLGPREARTSVERMSVNFDREGRLALERGLGWNDFPRPMRL